MRGGLRRLARAGRRQQRQARFEMRDDRLVLVRLPDVGFIDDKDVRPVDIDSHIGRRPVAEFGNSDGNLQMLQWATAGQSARFGLLVHHADGEREWAYGKDSSIVCPQRSDAGRAGWADRPQYGRVSSPDACQRRPAGTTAVG